MEFSHIPVLFNETIDSLNIKPDGLYVDCTAGGGGHSRAIAEKLTTGRLISIDRDPDAIKVLNERLGIYPQVTVVHNTFNNIKEILNGERADGIIADLGVSSFQLDEAGRGFSFHKDAPLDMRMSKQGTSARDLVNTLSVGELTRILRDYGEEKYANRIANNIVAAREKKEIGTTFELIDIIKSSMPQKAMRESHPARRTFQALRIEVNGELDQLNTALDDMFDCLKVGGILSIITFHSLEDRMVKQRFNSFAQGCTCPKEFPVCICGNKPKGELPFKSKAPTQAELEENPRARSSRLRAFKKY